MWRNRASEFEGERNRNDLLVTHDFWTAVTSDYCDF